MSTAIPGWYTDPYNPSALRYWDGTAWTAHTNQVDLTQDWSLRSAQQTVRSSKGMAVTALVVSLAGALLAVTSLITGPLAVIFGSIAIQRANALGESKTMAKWAIGIGIASFVFAVSVLLR